MQRLNRYNLDTHFANIVTTAGKHVDLCHIFAAAGLSPGRQESSDDAAVRVFRASQTLYVSTAKMIMTPPAIAYPLGLSP